MNLSGASLNDERFVREAFALLAAQPRAADRLCIEITESVALHDLANTRRFIDRVRASGAKVALDDFGAGYTSFSYLKELPADALKIDGSFVRGVQAHPANLAIVEAIAELSRNLGMQSIAEWAEECATVEALRDAGIDYAQGYVIARPQAPEPGARFRLPARRRAPRSLRAWAAPARDCGNAGTRRARPQDRSRARSKAPSSP